MSRPATLSPSQFSKMMTRSRKKGEDFGKTAISYAEEIARRHLGLPVDEFTSFDMQRGVELEPFAIMAYEARQMVEVQDKKRIYHEKYDFISGEPDGLVGDNGIVEVKSPNAANHFKNLMEGAQLEDYKYQIQGYLWITGREWCDFVSFHPEYTEKTRIAVFRIERNDEIIEQLEERSVKFWNDIVLPIIKKIESL